MSACKRTTCWESNAQDGNCYWMSVRARQGNGGALLGGVQIPPIFNISAPFIILPISTVPGPASSVITISTATTSTVISSITSLVTISTAISTTITIPITVIPTASLAAQQAAIKSNAFLAKQSIILVSALSGFTILLILVLALLAVLWTRRRRPGREKQDGSTQLTSMNLDASQPLRSQQAHPQATPALSDGHGALSSHPPDPNLSSFSRPFSVAGFYEESSHPQPSVRNHPLPTINVQPNTPSIGGFDDNNAPVSPILQAGPARTPHYHDVLQDGAPDGSSRLRLPIPERSPQRLSVSSAASDYADGITGQNTPEHAGGVLHSTRASSGVFPESS